MCSVSRGSGTGPKWRPVNDFNERIESRDKMTDGLAMDRPVTPFSAIFGLLANLQLEILGN